ncbi:HlyD family efflux transporter periplasmic adaptor subunit [Moraxellaceae bacterium AER2_44_116]|nr:HlyD family efflux transporter periplasmic adaptor subunit [Moraxellaceae bacterium AER2_44_116]
MISEDASLLVWDNFIHAKTSETFCRAWLALLCQQITHVKAAAVLVEGQDQRSFVPIAVWPNPAPDLSHLSVIVESCLKQAQSIVQASKDGSSYELAYPVMVGAKVNSLVVLVINGRIQEAQHALRQLHWSSAWLINLLSSRELELMTQTAERTSSVLESMTLVLRHPQLQQALFEVSNDLAQRFSCSKVAIGLSHHAHIRLLALSETAVFDKHIPLSKAYVAAMEECLDVGKRILLPVAKSNSLSPSEGVVTAPAITPTSAYPLHSQLLSLSKAGSIISYPLVHGAQTVGILMLEREHNNGFTESEQHWLAAFASLIAPIIDQRQQAERSSVGRLLAESRTLLTKLFGPRHLIWKTATALVLLAVVVLSVVHVDYRVSAKTVIEGEVQRVASAPFAGFIQAAYVRAGDIVHKAQPLAKLDDRELKIEQARWASERDQYDSKLREAVAKHNLTDVQVISAQLQQSEAQLALVSDKINRSQLTAPFDAMIVAGDLSQQIGAPIELGKELFTLAPLESYRVILQVDEREIRHLRTGQHGKLVIIGIASDPIPFTISKVTPVATVQDGKNFFRVEARLAQSSIRLRPGMEGVGKVETGQQQLWWILTHPLTEWLSLMSWKWLP